MTFFYPFLILLLIPASFNLGAQSLFGEAPKNLEPKIELLASAKRASNGGLKIHLIGRIEPGFHLYSVSPQEGPKPTRLELVEPKLKPQGPASESKPKLKLDQALDLKLLVHENQFEISRIYRGNPGPGSEVRGFLFFQLCDNLICLNPQKKYFSSQVE